MMLPGDAIVKAEIVVKTAAGRSLTDVTGKVAEAVKGLKEGICVVFVTHATAGILVNEYEPLIAADFLTFLQRLVPQADWEHNKIDDNAEAHLLAGLVGPSVAVPVVDHKLVLGTWQQIILCDFEGPRQRKIFVIGR